MPKKKNMDQKMDAVGYAQLSRRSNSPSASTREATAVKAMYKELKKNPKTNKPKTNKNTNKRMK